MVVLLAQPEKVGLSLICDIGKSGRGWGLLTMLTTLKFRKCEKGACSWLSSICHDEGWQVKMLPFLGSTIDVTFIQDPQDERVRPQDLIPSSPVVGTKQPNDRGSQPMASDVMPNPSLLLVNTYYGTYLARAWTHPGLVLVLMEWFLISCRSPLTREYLRYF